MKNGIIWRAACASLLVLTMLNLSACGIRAIPQQKNEVDAAWSEVLNQFQRRADLIPNIVNTVKGYAAHEKEALQAVVEARAKATSTNISAENLNAETMKKFQAAQGTLSSALSKLLLVVERYPDLKASQNFRDLQVQLEGTENRVTIARRRYIEAIKRFNNLVTVPPESFVNSMLYKYEKMPQFQIENEEQKSEAPKVSF